MNRRPNFWINFFSHLHPNNFCYLSKHIFEWPYFSNLPKNKKAFYLSILRSPRPLRIDATGEEGKWLHKLHKNSRPHFIPIVASRGKLRVLLHCFLLIFGDLGVDGHEAPCFGSEPPMCTTKTTLFSFFISEMTTKRYSGDRHYHCLFIIIICGCALCVSSGRCCKRRETDFRSTQTRTDRQTTRHTNTHKDRYTRRRTHR